MQIAGCFHAALGLLTVSPRAGFLVTALEKAALAGAKWRAQQHLDPGSSSRHGCSMVAIDVPNLLVSARPLAVACRRSFIGLPAPSLISLRESGTRRRRPAEREWTSRGNCIGNSIAMC